MYEVLHTLFDFVAKLLLVDLTTGYHFQSSVESITKRSIFLRCLFTNYKLNLDKGKHHH